MINKYTTGKTQQEKTVKMDMTNEPFLFADFLFTIEYGVEINKFKYLLK
ncbi:MAG: hypothetical protein GX905_02610 [Bacteroidales bacterium]|nr:hypothetical protein [Bacteroidales bacterium]